ncbi:MAG: hypothetical protein HZA50_02790 [Planctomycetes bacterium]|nr:hypothetical protein [Planctomycetota bacterium]
MKDYYRIPQVEDGQHNIILQNRCGNRLTLLFHGDRTELEFVYKPNAFRRKEYRARNFSNRDNSTGLFARSELPEIGAGSVEKFEYDPFVSRFLVRFQSDAKNTITVVNIPDENCFAMAARQPLLLSFRPHRNFQAANGLITEAFEDRGEQIVSFIKFAGFEANRFRVLDDGRYVLQLMENEAVLVGAEENPYQVDRICRKLGGMSLGQLIEHTEKIVAPVLSRGKITLAVGDDKLQRVVDLNSRVVWSALDAGGACFGALCRIYYLIWVRDGAMAASTFARAGRPDFVKIWAPFLLANPSEITGEDGKKAREFLQIVGTRWTKSEDDGIYYAVLSLWSLVHTTADDGMLADGTFDGLLDILEHTIAGRFDEQEGLFGSTVLGEDELAGSPYYGYDVVNGSIARSNHKPENSGPAFSKAYSLYQNINMYNCLRMAQILIAGSGRADLAEKAARYNQLALTVEKTLAERFKDQQGNYMTMMIIFNDGGKKWFDYAAGADHWEYAWAISTGPFLPDPARSLRSVRMAVNVWPTVKPYGYCPWNFLARYLREYGLGTADYRGLLNDQVDEALTLTQRYPMQGAVTEYRKNIEGWRALPFGTGSLLLSVVSNLVQALPQGLAVRAGDLVEKVDNFCYRQARINFTAAGRGDVVLDVFVNGQKLHGTLQLPENLLRTGRNEVNVVRGGSFDGLRLYSSDAALLAAGNSAESLVLNFTSPFDARLIFQNLNLARSVEVTDAAGNARNFNTSQIEDTGLTMLHIPGSGEFTVTVS